MKENFIRVKIDEKEQKDLFIKFIRRFKKNFVEASKYLDITKSSLSKYKRGVVRYIPKDILIKVVKYLNCDSPKIIDSGNLKEIRGNYMKKAHPILEKKYGSNWARELTNRRDFKGIHLVDFPDYIFVYLDSIYRKELLGAAYDLFGSLSKLAKVIKISPGRLSYWYRGEQKDYKRDKGGLQFIPLGRLKIISKYLVEDHRKEFSMGNIEKHLLMYRMRAGNPIKNPRFPIKESPELVRLLFHLLGDGYSGNKGENANYKNTCEKLLEEFKKDLDIFGDVPIYAQKYSIKFPRVLAEIIENFYQINSKTFDSYISDKIFQIPKRNLYFGIRAFADDEGCMAKSSVVLTSANYNLLKGIKQILDYLKIRRSEIKSRYAERTTYKRMYTLEIRDLEKYSRKIGFTHPLKRDKLNRYIKAKKAKRRKKLLRLKP